MASRFCTKCGSVASDGQKFCKICGQPLPAAAAAHEAVADPVFRPREPWGAVDSPGRDTGVTLAVKTCTKCQTVLTPDQRSCWVCGQPVAGQSVTGAVELAEIPVPASGLSASPSPTAMWTPVAEPDPSTVAPAAPAALITCAQCHTVLAAGQQSCWACGLPVGAGPAAGQVVAPAPAPSVSSFTAMWSEVAVGPVPTVPAETGPVDMVPVSTNPKEPVSTSQGWNDPTPADPVPAAPVSSNWATPAIAEPAAAIPAASPLTCANCHANLAEGQKFCRMCGTPVAAAPVTPAPAAFSTTPGWGEVATAPAPMPAAAPTPSTCGKCQSPLTPGQGICWVCGQAVGTAPASASFVSQSFPLESPPIAPSVGWPDPPATSAAVTAPEPAPEYPAAAAEPAMTCSKCAGELTPGQKFCRRCGTPVAASVAVAAAAESPVAWPAESVLPESTSTDSSSTAAFSPEVVSSAPQPLETWPAPPLPAPQASVLPETVATPPSPIAATITPVAATVPAAVTTRCPTCRTVLTAEQRVCWVCGQVLGVVGQHETLAEMGAPTETYKEVAVAIPEAAKTIPAVPTPLPSPSLSSSPVYPGPVSSSASAGSGFPAAAAYPPVALPPIGAQIAGFQPVPAAPVAASAVASVNSVSPQKGSNTGLWIVLIVLLLGAGGAGAWLYMRGAKPQTVATTSAAADSSSSQAAPASQPDPPPPPPLAPLNAANSGATPAPLPKPSAAGSTIDSGANSTPLPAKQAPATHSAPASSLASAPTPKFNPNQSVPPLDPMPAKPQSGTLRYSGPPIPQNGVVVFDHLPAGRLRFSYDPSIWHPTIARNPDGTQKLILRSSAPGSQTECVVQWQQIP